MFISKYLPLYAADDELGAAETETPEISQETQDTEAESPSSGRSALRKQLEKGFEDDRKATEAANKRSAKAPRRVAGGATVEPEETPAEGEVSETEVQPQSAAPEAFSKEAKAEWANVPPTVQAAILKRETDMAKGVEELKGKYKELDTALAPHMNAIRQHGHTPAQAVNQLFAWFQALAGNPDVAFPALAKSFGYDLTRFVQQPQQQQTSPQVDPAAQQQQQQTQTEITPAVQKLIDDMKAQFDRELSGFKTTFQQQQEAKTQEILANWSKGKPYFEEVRGLMAQLISSGAVPLKDGQVDLDGAYDRAIFAHPEVRAKVLADQESAKQAELKKKQDAAKKAQEEQLRKARAASTSLGSSAPSVEGNQVGQKKGKGKSVRESLMAAYEELKE